jgi:hypothetical protein
MRRSKISSTLSLHGCSVETQNTRPIGREVSINIFAESECFAATGKIVYELPSSAMRLAFEEVPLKSAARLREWLLKSERRLRAPLSSRVYRVLAGTTY